MENEESIEGEAALEELARQTAEERAVEVVALRAVPPTSVDPSVPPYSRGLLLDLVLKTAPVSELLVAYNMTPDGFRALVASPRFRADFAETKQRIADEGFTFRAKAQAQAEFYLQQAWSMVHDPETPANVRADLIKWTTKVANLEPRPADAGATAERVTININLGDDKSPVIISSAA